MSLLLILAMLAAYGSVIGHDFVTWDDYQHVLNNPRVNPPSWAGVAESWRHPYWGLYIPVSYTFFAAEAALSQWLTPDDGGLPRLGPAVFHVGSLALHIGCVLLTFYVLCRLLDEQGRGGQDRTACDAPLRPMVRNGAACAGALLMGLHPMQVESVAWISETRGLLCALGSLVAIRLYIECAAGLPARRSMALCYGLASLSLLLAALSKPAAVAVPLIAVAIDLGILRRRGRQVLGLVTPWLLLTGGVTLLTRTQQPDSIMAFVPSLAERWIVAGDSAAFYLGKLALPWPVAVDYGRTPQSVLADGWSIVAWAVPLLVVVVLCLPRSRRVWLTAAAVCFAWILPVLGFIPFDFQRISTVADRYVYLAMLGPALALAWLLAKHWRPWALGPTAAVLVALGALSFQQTTYWRDSTTLFTHELMVNPRSAVARYHLGLGLAARGLHDKAVEQFRSALELRPDFAEIHDELGNSLFALGMPDQAAEKFRAALAIDPNNVDAHLGLGVSLEALGRTAEARSQYLAALELWPDSPRAHYYLGNLALKEPGKLNEAVDQFEAAVRSNPAYAVAHANLAVALGRQGRVVKAIWHAEIAVRLDPALTPAWVQLGHSLALKGRRDEAAAAFQKALDLVPAGSESARQIQRWLRECQRPANRPSD